MRSGKDLKNQLKPGMSWCRGEDSTVSPGVKRRVNPAGASIRDDTSTVLSGAKRGGSPAGASIRDDTSNLHARKSSQTWGGLQLYGAEERTRTSTGRPAST